MSKPRDFDSGIQREPRSELPYTKIYRRTSHDPRHTCDTLGVLTFLLTLPDDWIVWPTHLAKRFHCGGDKMYRILKTLSDWGYITRTWMREAGRVKGIRYTVHELAREPTEAVEEGPSELFPQNPDPAFEKLFPQNPDPAFPDPIFAEHTKNVKELKTEREQESEGELFTIKKSSSPSDSRAGAREEIQGKESPACSPNGKASVKLKAKRADFEAFMQAYPKRAGGNPSEPAWVSFEKAARDVPIEALIEAVKRFAKEQAAVERVGTEFIPQTTTWLNQKRWKDYAADLPEGRVPPKPDQIWIRDRTGREYWCAREYADMYRSCG